MHPKCLHRWFSAPSPPTLKTKALTIQNLFSCVKKKLKCLLHSLLFNSKCVTFTVEYNTVSKHRHTYIKNLNIPVGKTEMLNRNHQCDAEISISKGGYPSLHAIKLQSSCISNLRHREATPRPTAALVSLPDSNTVVGEQDHMAKMQHCPSITLTHSLTTEQV